MLHIAIFEPQRELAQDIMHWLTQADYAYTCCSNQEEFLACLEETSVDLLLVDYRCTNASCFERFRAATIVNDRRLPMLFISEPDSQQEIVYALENGADDYMVKPLHAEELLSRIQVLIHRFGSKANEISLPKVEHFGPYTVDHQQRTILRGSQAVSLTGKDFSLAAYMFAHQNQLLSRHRLLAEVWGVNQAVNTRTVDMHVSRLRKSLKLAGSGFEIQTVHQHGYRMQGPGNSD